MAKIWIPKSWSGTNPPASGTRVFVGGKGAGKSAYETISAGQTKRCLQSNGRGSVFYGNVGIPQPAYTWERALPTMTSGGDWFGMDGLSATWIDGYYIFSGYTHGTPVGIIPQFSVGANIGNIAFYIDGNGWQLNEGVSSVLRWPQVMSNRGTGVVNSTQTTIPTLSKLDSDLSYLFLFGSGVKKWHRSIPYNSGYVQRDLVFNLSGGGTITSDAYTINNIGFTPRYAFMYRQAGANERAWVVTVDNYARIYSSGNKYCSLTSGAGSFTASKITLPCSFIASNNNTELYIFGW